LKDLGYLGVRIFILGDLEISLEEEIGLFFIFSSIKYANEDGHF